jgi:hypothetical protein
MLCAPYSKKYNKYTNILSHDWVTVYGVWIGNWICWTLTDPWLQVIVTVSLIHTVYSSPEDKLKSSQPAVSSAVFWERLRTADNPLSLGSRTVPDLSYQLLTSATHNDWTPVVLSLTHSPTHQPTTFHFSDSHISTDFISLTVLLII